MNKTTDTEKKKKKKYYQTLLTLRWNKTARNVIKATPNLFKNKEVCPQFRVKNFKEVLQVMHGMRDLVVL